MGPVIALSNQSKKRKGRIVVRGGGHGARTFTSGATALREFWTLAEQGFPATLSIDGQYAATSGVSAKEYPITWKARGTSRVRRSTRQRSSARRR
jgi:hypothetical protein